MSPRSRRFHRNGLERVRSDRPLTAQEELRSFHVPKGFVVELVAHEPQIAKPMNLAFDNRVDCG